MATQTLNLSLVGTKTAKKPGKKDTIIKPKIATKSVGYASATMTHEQFEKLTVIQQIRHAFKPGARIAAWIGLVLGGLIPVSTYVLVHNPEGVAAYPWLWVLVAFLLLWSAPTAYQWATSAFGSRIKALGFCVGLEGILSFVHITGLGVAALIVLSFINAVSAACQLQVRKQRGVEIDG